ncbi:MAG TPA: cobalt ECF transporter T component CbiQ [Anaerolineales bacterium]|nr:cobalt ECF transporter T component CbiQ [Anaerolineales bacterium]
MHLNTFDQYQARASLIHRLDPRVKVIVTILVILSNVLLPDGAWLAFALSWGLILGINQIARLGARYLLVRSFIALPFALAAVSVIFTVPGNPVFALGVGKAVLVLTDAGLIRFASILLRSWISVQAAIVLTATTPFPDLIHALRHLRVPSILVAIISFMYRYLFVLSDETLRLLRAREARSAAPLPGRGQARVGGSLSWRARVAGSMIGQLFLRSYERSDRVYNAMLARGYQGQLLTMHAHEMTPRDWAGFGLACFLLLLLQILGRV